MGVLTDGALRIWALPVAGLKWGVVLGARNAVVRAVVVVLRGDIRAGLPAGAAYGVLLPRDEAALHVFRFRYDAGNNRACLSRADFLRVGCYRQK